MTINRLDERYRSVWQVTKSKPDLSKTDVEGSRFFFERGEGGEIILCDGKPVPRRWNTYAIVCNLSYPEPLRSKFEALWQEFMQKLGWPLAYGVEPQNRHLEIFLFQRPGETFTEEEINRSTAASKKVLAREKRFRLTFRYPFITPDGTIVAKGYDVHDGTLDRIREQICASAPFYSKKQSQWCHTPLGRILEPVSPERFSSLIEEMEHRWNEVIGSVEVTRLLWTLERQWYMVDKEILFTQELR